MTIWADADSLPPAVRETIARRAGREASRGRDVKAVFVANRKIPVPANSAVSSLRVGVGPGAADAAIRSSIRPGDLVVTRDIPLAETLIREWGASVPVLNDRGGRFDADTIAERRSIRDAMAQLDAVGLVERPRASYGPREAKLFADAFDREMARLLGGPAAGGG